MSNFRMKLIGMLSICCIIASTNSFANAIDISEGPSGGNMQVGEEIISNEEQIERIKNDKSMPADIKEIFIAKLSGNMPKPLSSYRACDLGVPQIKQETSYYCGPASAMQNLKYFYNAYKDSSMYNVSLPASQDALADYMGTTSAGSSGEQVKNGLNRYQDVNYYIEKQLESKSEFKDDIDSALNVGSCPLIIRSRLTADSDFGYQSSGHFMTLGGQNNGLTKVLIVDPYYGFSSIKGPDSAKYYVSFDDAYESISTHFASQYIY